VPPASSRTEERRQRPSLAFPGKPRGVEGQHPRNGIDRACEIGIPAADDQIDFGTRRERSQVRQRRQRHQQIADALQPKNQDAFWGEWPYPPAERPCRRGNRAKKPICRRHQRPFAPIGDMRCH
jgi:hypothetical protein